MNAPAHLAAAIDREDLRTEAALRGETLPQVAFRRMRDAVDRGGHVSGAAWRALSDGLRQYIVMTCTARRDFESAALMPWQQFTADERIAMGALARSLARELKGAAWLR